MQKKYNRVLKIKIARKRRERETKNEDERKTENSPELQKPSVDTEIYNNNKKCD